MFAFLTTFFTVFLYNPLFNSLVLIYNYLPGHDFGLTIIILTVIIRVILYPVSVKTLNSQRALQKLQPKIQEIQQKYKDDREKQTRETLELYKREKISPFSGLLLALIQLPILIALYKVFISGLTTEQLNNLYSFVANPGHFNPVFLGIMDLSHPSVPLAVLAGILQFIQTKMLLPKPVPNGQKQSDFAMIMQKQMVYLFPVLTVLILFGLPSALGLYWTATSVFSIAQQYFMIKKSPA